MGGIGQTIRWSAGDWLEFIWELDLRRKKNSPIYSKKINRFIVKPACDESNNLTNLFCIVPAKPNL